VGVGGARAGRSEGGGGGCEGTQVEGAAAIGGDGGVGAACCLGGEGERGWLVGRLGMGDWWFTQSLRHNLCLRDGVN